MTNHTQRINKLSGILCVGLVVIGQAIGQKLPLEIHQDKTLYNYQSAKGVPLSSKAGNPLGSDGRAVKQFAPMTTNPPTKNQFSGFISWGAVAAPQTPKNLVTGMGYAGNAINIKLPAGGDKALGLTEIVLQRAQVGAPYLNRPVSYLFGGIISPPEEDESGKVLKVQPESYWDNEPYLLFEEHTDLGYYYSKHARAVFAIQPGPIEIVWRKSDPHNGKLSQSEIDATLEGTEIPKWDVSGGNYYRLYKKRYIVSGSAAKSPKKIYWNLAGFDGPLVTIPASSVGELKIVYNKSFPEKVPVEDGIPAQTTGAESTGSDIKIPVDGGTIEVPGGGKTVFTKTLWHQGDNLNALNAEGRVFVELLGDLREDGKTRYHLGYEIVDVYKNSNPADVTIELGDRVTAWDPAESKDDSILTPKPKLKFEGESFVFQTGIETVQYYAVRETKNLNDYQIHWMEEGLEGILWPAQHSRYKFIWPRDPARYSHYIRPQAETKLDASLTAVPMPNDNAPTIQYQDPLDGERAFFTNEMRFYTFLDADYPVHRTLLRFSAEGEVHFERVFSWLDVNLKEGTTLAQSALGLKNWLPSRDLAIWSNADGSVTDGQYDDSAKDANGDPNPVNQLKSDFLDNTNLTTPRYVNKTVEVGKRITAPESELGSGDEDYWAGYILTGTSYNPNAYINPIGSQFTESNKGAIIPVNANPDNNILEVYWYRKNGGPEAKGFKPIYWPSVLGRYTIQWPTSPDEIVLASNDGTGALPSLQAKGSIYVQNNSNLTGYNPNEEHALMIAGQAYALRDDLNITTGSDYSSDPFVLIEYDAADGRPAMNAFKVLREKPSENIFFDYIIEAGKKVPQPMPLGLLPKPVEGKGEKRKNFNKEIIAADSKAVDGLTTAQAELLEQTVGVDLKHYGEFTYEDRKGGHWVYRGLNAGPPPLQAGTYDANTGKFDAQEKDANATAKVGTGFSYTIHASRRAGTLTMAVSSESKDALPNWLTINSLTLSGTPTAKDATAAGKTLNLKLVIASLDNQDSVTKELKITVSANRNTKIAGQPPMDSYYKDANGQKRFLGNRPPSFAESPTGLNSFQMQFYYKTLEGFAWPGMSKPPAVDTIVPYLRRPDGKGGYKGDSYDKDNDSLNIVYRPAWPANTPVLDLSETLTRAKKGLPAVRGQTSIKVLYEQSIGSRISKMLNNWGPFVAVEKKISDFNSLKSVVLHDPTREKTYNLVKEPDTDAAKASEENLWAIPLSINTFAYQGKTYFPNLPPHLSNRLFFDPNRGEYGALVFMGEFVDEILGEPYLLLNVLTGDELKLAKDLCPDGDPQKDKWSKAIDSLSTAVQTFYEPTEAPGNWIANNSADTVVGKSGDKANAEENVGIMELAEITHEDSAVDSYALSASGPGTGYVTLIENDGNDPTKSGLPISIHVIRVGKEMYQGEIKVLFSSNPLDENVTFQHTADLGGKFSDFDYEWKIQPPVDGAEPKVYYIKTDTGYNNDNPKALASGWMPMEGADGVGKYRYTLGGSGIQVLSDNWIIMRYRPRISTHPGYGNWSDWTSPQLAEGWIKRVLKGINPFNQRSTDMFSNSVNTEGSMLTQAGKRWEGNIALNLDNINEHGLVEIYETVLNRGKMLSIDAGINYGPANDALLLAAGYLNDLYMMVGNEAYADAANPTIGIGTKDRNYGDIATSLFSFKGQVASLLEEELGLLRGRDDFVQPGVETGPIYNRMIWNYTRGIDSGEVIYALNYNIQEDQGETLDGSINAADAARMYPQGHGDAYGHYLTALKGYYKLITDADFTWAPRTEAVTVLGKPVQVDYMDERKFAAAAATLARTGQQVFDLTWRRDYKPGKESGWRHFSQTRDNDRRLHVEGDSDVASTRHWGMDHWAARTGIGSMVNWVVGNAMLPAEDTDPDHEGIQKIDRTTVPELQELAAVALNLQTSLDNAEAHLNPLGLSEDAIAFDIDPDDVLSETHYEQIYDRAKEALGNAMTSFDDTKDVTGMMRSEEDEINAFQGEVAQQELAYKHELIELYGTPYSDDIGVGKTYKQGYEGPDLLHFSYVDSAELSGSGAHEIMNPTETEVFELDIQNVPEEWNGNDKTELSDGDWTGVVSSLDESTLVEGVHKITYELGSHGFFSKPANWTGRRESPGRIQEAISKIIIARNAAYVALDSASGAKYFFDRKLSLFASQLTTHDKVTSELKDIADNNRDTNKTIAALEAGISVAELLKEAADDAFEMASEGAPETVIIGFSNGGNFLAPIKLTFGAIRLLGKGILNTSITAMSATAAGESNDNEDAVARIELDNIIPAEWEQERKEAVLELEAEFDELRGNFNVINEKLQQLHDARQNYLALLAKGNRIQKEREIFRQRASAVVQGFRTRDAAFRIFRNEKLERYKTLFDLSARYTYLAAKAYDYETGLLHTDQGKSFLSRIVKSRALGVIKDGAPQYAGSNTGDPGLSSVMAEMDSDWSVLKGRLGFNNPDTYGTTVSMRAEKFRILPGEDGSNSWRDTLERAKKRNLLLDPDVRLHCMQIDGNDGLPVPGIVLEFSTVIVDGLNLFGKPLSPGDSYFSPSSFANKIHSVGIAFDGYKGISDPNTNSSGIDGAGGASPTTPGGGFLDPQGLSATPYVYLIPAGLDSMRSPPLGDASVVRTWSVQDVAVPLPFNIGASELSTKKLWQSSDSLSEELFSVRKHQAFRAVSSANIFEANPRLLPDNYTNNRLIGRSVWNSKWKLVIPGKALLNDPDEGLDRFIQTVKDIKIHLQTYSYSGN